MSGSGASASTPVEPQADERPWTPGPWVPEYRHGIGVGIYAAFPGMPEGTRVRVADAVGNKRDANLIAAAPDLYEALAELFTLDGEVEVALGGNPIVVDRLVAKCVAALAKARGEA